MLYLIEILHQTTTSEDSPLFCYSCILSKFYIKPQHSIHEAIETFRCILSKFYIKPQLLRLILFCFGVVSYRNSTSNHNRGACVHQCQLVVSYRNSTSNHNSVNGPLGQQGVVSYRNSTSNHNFALNANFPVVLYLIEILHQTTTQRWV